MAGPHGSDPAQEVESRKRKRSQSDEPENASTCNQRSAHSPQDRASAEPGVPDQPAKAGTHPEEADSGAQVGLAVVPAPADGCTGPAAAASTWPAGVCVAF